MPSRRDRRPRPGSTTLDRAFEDYCFLRICSVDLHQAARRLERVRGEQDSEVRFGLLETAIVTYARPFSGNRGVHWLDPHRLPAMHVPVESTSLHAELMDLRNQLFAHSDLAFHEPEVLVNVGTADAPVHPFRFKRPPFEVLLGRAADFAALVDQVAASVEGAIAHEQAAAWFGEAERAGKVQRTVWLGSINLAGKGSGTHLMPFVIDRGAPRPRQD